MLSSFAPRAGPGGFSRFLPFAVRGRQGPLASLAPRFAGPPLAPVLAAGRRAFAPSGPGAGGAGFWVPSRPCRPLPAGLPPLPAAGGGWLPSFAVGFCGGALWLVRCLSLPLRRSSCRPAVRWRPGLARRWASRSARPPAPCWVWSPLCGFLPLPLRLGSRGRGARACPPPVAAVWCAPRPLALALRRPGASLSRSPRRPRRFGVVARRAVWRPSSPPGAALALSRAGAFGRVRGGSPRRLPFPPRAGFAGRALCRLSGAAGGWRGRAPRSLVWLARVGVRCARPRLARRGGAPAGPAPLSGLAAAGRVCSRWRSRASGLAASRSAARRRCALRAPRPRSAPGFFAAFLVAPLRGAPTNERLNKRPDE